MPAALATLRHLIASDLAPPPGLAAELGAAAAQAGLIPSPSDWAEGSDGWQGAWGAICQVGGRGRRSAGGAPMTISMQLVQGFPHGGRLGVTGGWAAPRGPRTLAYARMPHTPSRARPLSIFLELAVLFTILSLKNTLFRISLPFFAPPGVGQQVERPRLAEPPHAGGARQG